MNIDVGLNIQKMRVGGGIITRKDDGSLIKAWATSESKLGEPEVEEALAIRQALNIAKQNGWRKIMIQFDCKRIIDKIREKNTEDSNIGVILFDILKISQDFAECYFSFIKREGNCVAHQLAKFTIHLIHEIVWKDSFPDWLNSLARRRGANEPSRVEF